MPSEKEVLDALSAIIDPDLGRDIVSLGFIKNLCIEKGNVSFAIELTTPACPVRHKFKSAAEQAVAALPGVKSVHVAMTARKRAPSAEKKIEALDKVEAIVAVSSCKGGVGKSTVAAHLARALQREGLAVGLLDLDIHGPSLPTLLKVHAPEIHMEGETLFPVEVDGLKTMSLGYMFGDRPAVMRGPMLANYTLQILRQTEWGPLDYLIIDLPPGTGDTQLTLVQQVQLDGAVIVTTPQALSLVDVSRGILMFEKVEVPVLGLVENMAYFECDGCGKRHFVFGNSTDALTERFGLQTLARLPLMPGISETSRRDSGADIEAFTELAQNLHRAIGKRRASESVRPVASAVPGFIRVQWPDGKADLIPNKKVRASCQCAHCVSEFTGEALLDPAAIPDDIEAESLDPLGNYAVSIAWSDGHSSGIFSWEHLRKVAAG
jgi:Mrp family chromosome partitioning ATPase/DUF971 family protein